MRTIWPCPEGSGEGIERRRVYWNYYKGHMDKIKGEGGGWGGRWVWLGWGGGMGRKGRQLLLNNNLKNSLKKEIMNFHFIIK